MKRAFVSRIRRAGGRGAASLEMDTLKKPRMMEKTLVRRGGQKSSFIRASSSEKKKKVFNDNCQLKKRLCVCVLDYPHVRRILPPGTYYLRFEEKDHSITYVLNAVILFSKRRKYLLVNTRGASMHRFIRLTFVSKANIYFCLFERDIG